MVKVTQEQYDAILWHLETYDLMACLEFFHRNDGVIRMGIRSSNLRGELSDEDIATIWLDLSKAEVVK